MLCYPQLRRPLIWPSVLPMFPRISAGALKAEGEVHTKLDERSAAAVALAATGEIGSALGQMVAN